MARSVRGTVTGPTRRDLLGERSAQCSAHFSPRLEGHFPYRKRCRIFTWYGSLLPRSRTYSSSSLPFIHSFIWYAHWYACRYTYRPEQQNRPRLLRARAVHAQHVRCCRPSSRKRCSPEFAPCPRRRGWVARLHRAVVPQPLLMRVGAAIRLLTEMIANVANCVKVAARIRAQVRATHSTWRRQHGRMGASASTRTAAAMRRMWSTMEYHEDEV